MKNPVPIFWILMVVLSVALIHLPYRSVAQECIDYTGYPMTLDRIDAGNDINEIRIQGNYGYVAVWTKGLRIIDITNPNELQVVGNLDLPGGAEDVCVRGNYAYLTSNSYGLHVVDISNPSDPQHLKEIKIDDFNSCVAVSGSYVYVGAWSRERGGRLYVVDVSIPSTPSVVLSQPFYSRPNDIEIVGNFAYIACYSGAVWIIDITNPDSPQPASYFGTDGGAVDLVVEEGLLYIADTSNGFLIYDVSDPFDPVFISTYNYPGDITGVGIHGHMAVLASGYYGLLVVDISSPEDPILMGRLASASSPNHLAISDGIAYVASGFFYAVDLGQLAFPLPVGRFSLLTNIRDVCCEGHFAYAASGYEGIRVLDIADSSHPVQVGSSDLYDESFAVEVEQNHAYVAEKNGIRIYDVSDSSAPVSVGFYQTDDSPTDISVSNGFVYLTTGYASLGIRRGKVLVYSVLGPATLSLSGSIDLPDIPRAIAPAGSTLLVAGMTFGLQFIDIHDPTNPQLLSQVAKHDDAREIIIQDTIAYVATWRRGLMIVDFADPGSPIILSEEPLAVPGYDLGISSGIAYVATGAQGIQIFDVTTPTRPVHLGCVSPNDIQNSASRRTEHVDIIAGTVYVQCNNDGLVILPTHCFDETPVILTSFDVVQNQDEILMTWTCPGVVSIDEFALTLSDGVLQMPVLDIIMENNTFKATAPVVSQASARSVTVSLFLRDANDQLALLTDRTIEIDFNHDTHFSIDAHPNPFNSTIQCMFTVPRYSRAELSVYDSFGRRVRSLVANTVETDHTVIPWDGRDHDGRLLPSGSYFLRLKVNDTSVSKKITLIK